MSDSMKEFKDLYLQTAKERIKTLSDLLLKLESNPDQKELISELMRAGHSLKGESAAMGYTEIASLAHLVEDLFTGIGDGKMSITDEIMDALLSSLDVIADSIASIEEKDTELSLQNQVSQLKKLTGLNTEGFGKSAAVSQDQPPASVAPTSTSNTQAETTKPVEKPDKPAQLDQSNTASTSHDPAEITIATETTQPTMTKPGKEASTKTHGGSEKITAITIKTDKLDQMMGLAEELVLLKMKLKTHKTVEADADLKAEIHRLDRLVTDLQFHIMQTRLFPISLALATIPRLVRDTAKKTGKTVRLEIEGEDTTVDRTIIDHLSEPFVHMIRNSIDHGIEAPEERKKIGKPEEAYVKIKAYTKENKFYTEVSDDGRGIEWDKVVQAAIKKGYTSAKEAQSFTQKEIEELLYKGGVSTNEVITDVSGRGVGMAAIKEAIKKLGGGIDIKTQVGKGTTFIFRLPLTLAIMQALLVKVSGQTYAIPGNEVIRSIQFQSDEIQKSGNTPVIVVDETRVPIINIAQLFEIPREQTESQMSTVVLLHQDNEMIGCLVDKILSEEEILVKPLGHLLKRAAYFSGTTILANGSAAPIINVEGLSWKQQNH